MGAEGLQAGEGARKVVKANAAPVPFEGRAMYGVKHCGGNRYVFHPPVTVVQR
jgi:hypothetical protein